MFALHPYEYVYFNGLVDTETPGALAKRYDMDYWRMSERQSMEYLLARYPDDALRVWMRNIRRHILPQNARERIPIMGNLYAADFYLWTARGIHLPVAKPQEGGLHQLLHPLIDPRRIPDRPPIHSVKAYGNAISLIYGKDDDAYRAAYADVVANGDSLARADFDIYAHHDALYYLSADCPPPAPSDAHAHFLLHITPADPVDLPAASRERGFENRDFRLDNRAAFFDGKCMHRELLPGYPIARIRTGQKTASGAAEWRADIDLAGRAAARAVYESVAAGDYGKPVAQANFDVYARGNTLAYLKENCDAGDADARFFLHIFPANPADLPANWRERGFANLDFRFAEHGVDINGKCMATRELPDYAITLVRTGQKATVASGGDGWRVDIDLAALAEAQALYEGIAAGEYGKPVAQSDFDVYLRGNGLAYLKEPCAEDDTHARFFLHITPANPADLPADRRERGFANKDFKFAEHGSYVGDKCVAEIELPDYAIDRIRTGQFVSGEGAIWRAEFPAAR